MGDDSETRRLFSACKAATLFSLAITQNRPRHRSQRFQTILVPPRFVRVSESSCANVMHTVVPRRKRKFLHSHSGPFSSLIEEFEQQLPEWQLRQ